MSFKDRAAHFFGRFLAFPAEGTSPDRYRILRRNLVLLMLAVTILPLTIMAGINYHLYKRGLKNEIIQPIRALTSKTRHSFQQFFEERLSLIRSIAHLYSFTQLSDEKVLNHVLLVLKKEFGGFVDLGLISGVDGTQISYAGPYALLGKNYSAQGWYQEVMIKGIHISDVFMGYRKFPHIAIAVQHLEPGGFSWIVRATIDTDRLNDLIASMGLGAESDAFLVNRDGILQTPSRFYGSVLSRISLPFRSSGYGTDVVEKKDLKNRGVFIAHTRLIHPDYTLVLVKPRSEVMKTWYTLKSEIFFVLAVSVSIIMGVVLRLMNVVVRRLKESNERRDAAFRELEHSQKLSSIGRLAAGVAHEINNPLAIINEKAGLMKDLIQYSERFENRRKFLSLTDAILQSVDRCRTITHRLLGFARRIDVSLELLDLNELIREVLGFLEKEALYRDIDLKIQMAEDLPRILSDRSQLQQVFLNILTNAFAAVEDGGMISITTWKKGPDLVAVSFQDNGNGMTEETMRHIFEPFFTTKKGYGTGLGLPITYGIVKKLGGDIEVQSREGEGTVFFVYLPIKTEQGAGRE